jgi:hypothetical protein
MLSCAAVGATPHPLGRPGVAARQSPLSLAAGCLGIVAACVAVGAAAAHYLPLPPTGDPTVPRIFAVLVGALGGLGLSSVWSIAAGHGRGAGTRSALYARARTDAPPEDGQPIVATGVVRADRPLTSPIGGVACAAYDFVMFDPARTGDDDGRRPVYWGYASEPFAIDGRSRRYGVAGAPLFSWKASHLDDAASRARARAYVRSTGWETVESGMPFSLDTVFQRAGAGTAPSGRRDFGLAYDTAPDVALLTLEEHVLPVGAQVSAFGTWSSAQGAIVAPPSPLPASFVVVARGGPESLDGAPGVPQSTVAYVATAIVLLALAAGLFYLATLIIPAVRS